jgi:hypothetical protein
LIRAPKNLAGDPGSLGRRPSPRSGDGFPSASPVGPCWLRPPPVWRTWLCHSRKTSRRLAAGSTLVRAGVRDARAEGGSRAPNPLEARGGCDGDPGQILGDQWELGCRTPSPSRCGRGGRGGGSEKTKIPSPGLSPASPVPALPRSGLQVRVRVPHPPTGAAPREGGFAEVGFHHLVGRVRVYLKLRDRWGAAQACGMPGTARAAPESVVAPS